MKPLLVLICCLPPLVLFPQDKQPKSLWFPRGNLYPSIRLDYMESQVSVSYYFFHAEHSWQDRAFGNVSLGFRTNVLRWRHPGGWESELGLEVAVFTQFIFEDPYSNCQTNLFNVEYKVGVHYQARWDRWRFRGRMYHISTHLGDDYMFRNGIREFMDNLRIYEVVDVSAAWVHNGWKIYGIAGVVYHSAYPRDPLLLQTGVQFDHPVGTKRWIRWVSGIDLRLEEEQGFRPGLHAGAGCIIGNRERFRVTILAEYYNGYLPYSLYDKLLLQWVGASLYLSPSW